MNVTHYDFNNLFFESPPIRKRGYNRFDHAPGYLLMQAVWYVLLMDWVCYQLYRQFLRLERVFSGVWGKISY